VLRYDYIVPESVGSSLELLRFLPFNHVDEVFPSFSVALSVVLPIPAAVTSGAHSLSKLRLTNPKFIRF
jgi:hypothetical protein